ncbi:MAG: protein kinase [Gemmatimonadota bacterium]|nr:protein kinase [Gemmatimonadota bacterium]
MPDLTTELSEALAGRYAIERELGRGGMATVYLAQEHKHNRQVAIKVLHRELGASLGAERFLREIGIVARLSHPHIVPLIDSGTAAGLLYYVSPFVPGGSLRDRIVREQRLPVIDALRIAQEVGTALDYAHRGGFVHRDVKPENILFNDGQAVLADFGVARASTATPSDIVTEAGMALGTPTYMSPEQAAGDRDVGVGTDVYSLACVVYEMLAGEPPFSGANARAVLMKQVMEPPRPIRALRPEVPVSVERSLARALAKEPHDRYSHASEFAAALQARDPELHLLPATTRSIAVLPFVNASPDAENEYLSDGITDELIDALAKVDGLRVASRTSVFALKGKPQDVRAIGALLGASEVLEGTVRRAGDRLRITAQLTSTEDGRLIWSQRYDRTLHDVFAIQDEIARTIVDTLRVTSFADFASPVARRSTGSVTAYQLYLRGRYAWNKRTQEGVAEAIDYFEQAIAEDPAYALAYTGLADAYALHVDYRSVPVHEGFARAKDYARKALALDDGLAEAHASLAWSLFVYDWDWAGAATEFRRSIALDPRYATAHQWYAFLLASRGQLEEALVEGHTAQELDASSVSVRRSLAWIYYYARRYEPARYHLSRAIAMNPGAEETYRVLGLTLAIDGQLDEAERVLREAVSMAGSGSYTSATLGFAMARAGKRAQAEELLARLEHERARSYVSPVALATLLLGLGYNDRALDWAEKAYDERRGWLAYLTVNPLLDPVRGDPRFEALVVRMQAPR